MIGSGRFTAAFASGADATDPDIFRSLMRGAARAGFAIVLCETGTKLPLCPLSSIARKRADEQVQEAARAAGDRRWAAREHPCGRAHATTDPKALDTYLARRFKNGGTIPNVAVEVGASRMLCIDVDTPAELAAWAASWQRATGTAWPADGLTVASPGVLESGSWKHHGGGHVWVDLAELPESASRDLLLAAGSGVYKDPSGWTAMYRDRYVLVPPSRRPEGPYEYLGAFAASDRIDWLVTAIARDAVARETARMETAERRATRLADPATMPGDRALIEWSVATPWAELLAGQSWVDTGLVHSCGCPDWTMAPVADHASPRSATAHEDGCSAEHYTDDEGHGAVHLWSDTRPPYLRGLGPTMTKLQFVAATARPQTRHGQPLSAEDLAGGLRSLGLTAAGDLRPLLPATVLVAPNPAAAAPVDATTVAHTLATLAPLPAPSTGDTQPAVSTFTEASVLIEDERPDALDLPPDVPVPRLGTLGVLPQPAVATGELVPVPAGASSDLVTGYRTERHFLDLGSLLALPDPEPLITDVLDLGAFCRIFGQSGHGKTFVAVDLVCSVLTGRPWAGHEVLGRGRVVYLAAEDAKGVGTRIAHWVRHHQLPQPELNDLIQRLRVITYAVQANSTEWDVMLADVMAFGPALVVIDTQAQTSVGYEENSNSEMMEYVKRVAQLIVNTGACVALIAHTDKTGTRVRGASSVYGALDLEYQVVSDLKPQQTITITNTKAKNRPRWAESVTGALIPTGDRGAVMSFDPTQIPDAAAAAAREEISTGARDAKLEAVFAVLAARPTTGLGKTSWARYCQQECGSYADTGRPRIPQSTAERLIEQLIQAGRVTDLAGHVVGREVEYTRGMTFRALVTDSPEPGSDPTP